MNPTLEHPKHPTFTQDPAWLAELRVRGMRQFNDQAMPSARDEEWRFAGVGKLRIDGFAPAKTPETDKLEALVERSRIIDTRSGCCVYVDDTLAAFEGVHPESAAQGVLYLPLSKALAEHPELMRKYFLQESTDLGSQKFFGLHTAMVKAGTLLYIPKGVEIEHPFINYYWTGEIRSAVFPHTLIIAEDHSKVSVIDVFFSDTEENEALNISVSNIQAGTNADVFRKVVQDWNEKTLSFQLDTTVAQRDARVKNLALNIGAKQARFESQSRIEGPGAEVKMYSLTVAENHQEFDQRTFQTHNAPNAVSDLLYKNALLDNSRSIFSGLIKVAEGAYQTDAYQTNRNLLLDPTAEANALPGLEILANDVRCSHGATTGNIDPEDLFYMMQRGIRRRVAIRLLVFGFFEEVIDQIDSEAFAEAIRALIHKKLEAKIG